MNFVCDFFYYINFGYIDYFVFEASLCACYFALCCCDFRFAVGLGWCFWFYMYVLGFPISCNLLVVLLIWMLDISLFVHFYMCYYFVTICLVCLMLMVFWWFWLWFWWVFLVVELFFLWILGFRLILGLLWWCCV